MQAYHAQLIETGIAIALFIGSRLITKKFVSLIIKNTYFKSTEGKDVTRLLNLLLFTIFSIILIAIWSVKQENILLFASSLLTVFGVALFAEMSILSNITACLILFFQHPIKVGDQIAVNHEGNEVEGELIDITYFFVFVKTKDRGVYTIPNAALLKSSFSVLESKVSTSEEK